VGIFTPGHWGSFLKTSQLSLDFIVNLHLTSQLQKEQQKDKGGGNENTEKVDGLLLHPVKCEADPYTGMLQLKWSIGERDTRYQKWT